MIAIIKYIVEGKLMLEAKLAALQYGMSPGVTPISKEIYGLRMIIFWICLAIGLAVFSVMFYVIFKGRQSKSAIAANFHEHPCVEFVWALIPFILLVLMVMPATKGLMKMKDNGAIVVNVIRSSHIRV